MRIAEFVDSLRSTQTDDDHVDVDVTLDEALHLLSNTRRRHVIEFLAHENASPTLRELSEHVTARENDTSVDRINPDDRKSMYVVLYQNHVPILAEAGVIDYDGMSSDITATRDAFALAEFLEDVREQFNGGDA